MEAVIDKLVIEQLLDKMPADIRIWLCEQKPTTGNETGRLTHDYMLARRRQRVETPKADTHSQQSNQQRSGNDARKCYSCGQHGHIAPKCPNLPATQPAGSETQNRIEKSDGPKLKDRKCHTCNQKGHLAKDCPSAFYCYSQTPVSKRRRGDQGVVVTGRGVGGVGLGGRDTEENLGVVVVRKKGARGEGDNGGGRETRDEEGTGVLGGTGEAVWSVEGVDVVGCGDVSSCNKEITGGGEIERSLCGMPVTTCGMVNGHEVNDIVLDTGCSHTMIHQDLLPTNQPLLPGSAQVLCAHSDIIVYPLAQVLITVNWLTKPVVPAVSKTLPVSALLGTDIPARVKFSITTSPRVTPIHTSTGHPQKSVSPTV